MIISDFKNMTKCVDDTLLWNDSIEDCFFTAAKFLDTCGRNGIVLHPGKFQFAQEMVEFAGFDIDLTEVRPSRKYVDTIKNFPQPKTLTDMRSFFGLVPQVAFAFYMSDEMLPFRDMLKPKNTPGGKLYWDQQLQQIFDKAKQAIIKEVMHGVKTYDPKRRTCLATDWSKTGLCHTLLQKYCRCEEIKPNYCENGCGVCLVGSRFTNPAEANYAPIEGEALAVADGLEKHVTSPWDARI